MQYSNFHIPTYITGRQKSSEILRQARWKICSNQKKNPNKKRERQEERNIILLIMKVGRRRERRENFCFPFFTETFFFMGFELLGL